MSALTLVPETKVLAIASHVTYGYVGNTMATFVLQLLGCEVSAINTVHYSNHTAYKQIKGTKTSAEQIAELFEGLKQSHLDDFDVLLSGYIPSAEGVATVGKIGRELRLRSMMNPGSFFWVMDPVMGDEGRLYIPEDEVPVYRSLLREADLILPNQFEVELLSESTINSISDLTQAVEKLHREYQIPHIIITSLRLKDGDLSTLTSARTTPSHTPPPSTVSSTMTIVGSTAKSDHTPRLFRIDIPAIPCFFSGTGDMFAALTVARLREAVAHAEPAITNTARWQSPDEVPATELPLAKSTEKVLASMQAVLAKTYETMEVEMAAWDQGINREQGIREEGKADKERHLAKMKASEVRLIRNQEDLRNPPHLEKFKARAVEMEEIEAMKLGV
ncbi:putative pyridoxal kinase [Eremomyces bilateralis CBS 781.70]|uniref:pyridoxal kinase n=1 Tax=Eremomyces bilateralis CBS 781.70 TaxID=1392243 RepID=A0A6G1G7M0_9PEZI|nr:putative pyridoxal kinase [Eremomyces bilateralis CBS 781.70]KAF1814024.1 putative pyridoxal kinase [Eremomyces bilateralis CBS 781.70]